MKELGKKSHNIVMWLRETDDHDSASFFYNEKEFAYHKFFKEMSRKVNFRFAFGTGSYISSGTFSNVYRYKNGGPIPAENKFVTEVIYQFSNMVPAGFSVAPAKMRNTSEFKDFCNSKIKTYKYLPQFFPKTFIVYSEDEIKSLLTKIKTDKVVLKPNHGMQGNGVFIFPKDKINFNVISKDELKNNGFLVQEFINTSGGIPGIVTSYHDLRIITFGNKISLCHIRQPQKGSLISNYHRGATITEVPIDSIPEFILDFYKKVHKKVIKKFPNPVYSMDIGVGKDGPKLIELNSSTAFPRKDFKCLDTFINNLIEYLTV